MMDDAVLDFTGGLEWTGRDWRICVYHNDTVSRFSQFRFSELHGLFKRLYYVLVARTKMICANKLTCIDIPGFQWGSSTCSTNKK